MLRPGTLIASKYQIEHLIAEGGMAELYLARCLNNKTPSEFVAIKRLLPHLRKLNNHAELFMKEAHHIIALRSDYIVQGIELICDGSEHLLVMEYILGLEIGHLGFKLKKHSIKNRIAVATAVGMAIARALKCIREWPGVNGKALDLVHGDISGQNILINADGQVKLVDFGMAMCASRPAALESELLGGTIRYMSPEQRQGQLLTQASDIYSLAIVLEEIIGEEVPHSSLYRVLAKAKANELNKRYKNADELLVDLEKVSLSYGVWDPKPFLRGILEYPPKNKNQATPSMSIIQIVSVGGALVLVVALMISLGPRYFYPRIPDIGLDDHHCEDYGEDLGRINNF